MSRRLRRRQFTLGLGRALTVGAAVAGVGLAGRAHAAREVEVEARVSAPITRVGESVQLTLIVRVRGGQPPRRLPLPTAAQEHFDLGRAESQTGRSGNPFSAASMVYTRQLAVPITPRDKGTFELGFSVEIDGETYESNVPTLEVLGGDEALPEPPPGRDPTEAQGPVFLWAAVDKDEAYVGEQITYALDVYEQRSFLGIHLRKPPSFADFFTEELPEGEQVVKAVGSTKYRVRPGLRRALFPQKTGTLQIGSAELSVGGRQRILSRALDIEVKPLPGEGRPPGFSANNVGRYSIQAEVDRSQVAANEPVTLRITIQGEGNVKFIDPGPWPAIEGVRRYDPKVESSVRKGTPLQGMRRFEFLLIPERGGTVVIPSHTLAFFDPVSARYEVAGTEPIEIEVEGNEGAAATPAPTAEPVGEEVAPLVFGTTLPRHTPRERWLDAERWTYGMLAVPVLAAAGLGGAALWRRFGPDEQAQAKARRRQRHRALIEAAEKSVDGGDGFHSTLAKLLQEIAVERAGVDGVGLPRPELLRVLGQQGVPPADVERLRDLLDQCDVARFGAQPDDARNDRQALLEEVLDLVRTSRLAKEAP